MESGRILADGTDVSENYAGWLKNIGYIPQTIFMIDDSIRRNVAFGVPEEEIDDAKVWRALEEAALDDFVKSLPEGVETGIGERGIRISGGQRQRISIARALYEDPEVLVLDEATSALDNETEAAIMDSINRLHGRKTLVIIAHRLQTIEKCDMVYRVQSRENFQRKVKNNEEVVGFWMGNVQEARGGNQLSDFWFSCLCAELCAVFYICGCDCHALHGGHGVVVGADGGVRILDQQDFCI